MVLIGINWGKNAQGETIWNLHVSRAFDAYYSDEAAGRDCAGEAVEAIYAGTYDCSKLRVGQEIEIFYERAVTTKNSKIFQPIKLIQVIEA